MSALPTKLGIVAGGGVLPKRLIDFCDERGISVFIIGFEGQTNPDLLKGRNSVLMRLGEAGSIVRLLKENAIADLVLIGSIKRPGLRDLRPDLYTVGFFAGLGFRALGDDGLLKAIRKKLEGEGFRIHGIHELIPALLTPHGAITALSPDAGQSSFIQNGIIAARKLGKSDKGQAVVVRQGAVFAYALEDAEGTDALIERCAAHGHHQHDILVKMCKPQQDRKLDMPTIGPRTVELCAQYGYAGIAVEAGSVLLVDEVEIRRLADAAGMFVVGVT